LAQPKGEPARLGKSQHDIDLNAERGKKQLDATEDSIRTLAALVKGLVMLISQTQADNTAKERNAAAVANLNVRATAVKSGLPDPGNVFAAPAADADPAGSDLQARNRARDDFNQFEAGGAVLAQGRQLNSDQTAMMQEIYQAMTGPAGNQRTILEFVKKINADQNAKNQAL
jgi:hypothetical protein